MAQRRLHPEALELGGHERVHAAHERAPGQEGDPAPAKRPRGGTGEGTGQRPCRRVPAHGRPTRPRTLQLVSWEDVEGFKAGVWTWLLCRPRGLRTTLLRQLESFPAVLVTGSRQAGKTTLLQTELGGRADHVSLDDPLERAFALEDPNGFLDRFQRPLILDEIQHAPELLPHIKLRVDRGRSGRFILTGSQHLPLMAGVSESLAGRVAVLDLLPFSQLEHAPDTLEEAIWCPRFPEPALHPGRREPWLRSFVPTYLERDVRLLRGVGDLCRFQTFLGLCAARHAQELNLSRLGREAGVSQPTARAWLSVLEATYLAHLLPPWSANLGKRLVRSPRLYLTDSGLVAYLGHQPSAEAALAGAMGGPLLEGWVVAEALKVFAMAGRRPEAFFWRSHDGLEVDLLVLTTAGICPVEVRLTATPTARHADPLTRLRALLGEGSAPTGVLVCRVAEPRPLPGGHLALPWSHFPAWIAERV